jgi:signal transduction histidine kinase
MAGERLRGTSIVWRFALTSLLVFALIGVGIATTRERDLRARSEAGAAVRAGLIAEGVIAPLLRPADLEAPAQGARYRELDRAIHGFAMDQAGIERIKIWAPNGTILFSNDPAQVGLSPEPEEDLLEALEGELTSEISDLDEPENASERRLADQLFETYVPVSVDGVGGVGGVDTVIEVYQDYSQIQQEIDRLDDTLTISLGVGLLALYVLLLPLMVGTTRTLRRQNAQLHDQAEQLAVLLEREQDTVAELRELDRMKSDFVAAASHELRTPLTAIRGFAELLQEQPGTDDRTREAAETIARQTAHLQRLVANLLREAQLEHAEAGPSDAPTSIEEVLEEVRRAFPGAADRIRIDVEGPLRTLPEGGVVLHEIVANLVDNALKYSPADEEVRVEAALRGDALVVCVRDRGKGIAAGDLPRIFDRFFQIDQSSTRAHGGVGLGLHLVRELSRRLGGDVTVDSVLGRGSVFTVTIPIGPTGDEPGAPALHPETSGRLTRAAGGPASAPADRAAT